MRYTAIIVVALCVLAALVPFALFVWPTKYRYDYVTVGPHKYPVRINRIDGDAEILRTAEKGWESKKY